MVSGTGIILMEDLACHMSEQGEDRPGLDRWIWVRLKGKREVVTWIVSTYQPFKSQGKRLAYQQQLRNFSKMVRGRHRAKNDFL